MRDFLRRDPLIVLFLCRIVLGFLPFLQIPFVIKSLGLESWSKLAVVQSLAIFLGPLVDLGWSSRFWDDLRFPNKAKLLMTALRQKLSMLTLISFIALPFFTMVSSIEITNQSGLLIFLAFLSTLTGYLSNAWYWISTQKIKNLIMIEILPKVFSNLIAVIYISISKDVFIFFIILILANLVPAGLTSLFLREYLFNLYKSRMIPNITYAFGLMLRTGYITSTLWFISYLGYIQIALVAIIDKLYRLVSALNEPLSSSFVFKHTNADAKHLVKENLFKQAFMTLILFPALANSVVSNMLFGSSIQYGTLYWLYYGLALTVVGTRTLSNAFSIYKGDMRQLSKFQYLSVFLFLIFVMSLGNFEIPIQVLAASIIAESFFCLKVYRAIFVK